MKAFVGILKAVCFFAVFIVGCASIIMGYEKYETHRKDEEELAYGSREKWSWHNKSARIQIFHDKAINQSILRMVDVDRKYVVYASKNDKFDLETEVVFLVKCKPKTKITTTKVDNFGNPKILTCNESGDELSYGVVWKADYASMVVWQENIDGLSFYANFSDWKLYELDREITLKKAK